MAELQQEEDYELQHDDRDDEMLEEDVDQDLLEEEQEYDTDEEVDKRQYGIYQALPVDDAEPDWEPGEPTTVEEYLRRVRYEARQLPSIVTSKVDPRQFNRNQTTRYPQLEVENDDAMECSEDLKPTIQWVRLFLRNFAALRHRLQREFDIETGQVPGLPLRIPPSFSLNTGATTEHAVDSPSSLMPELVALKGLDQVKIVTKILKAVRALVRSSSETTFAPPPPPPSQLPELAAEIYALSARVERPLHADTAASYRSLLRKCKIWRVDFIDSPTDPLLPHLNILIGIAGGYFRQDEELSLMWDEDEEDLMMEEEQNLVDIML